jgi:predicted PurR-regulated permease PerM
MNTGRPVRSLLWGLFALAVLIVCVWAAPGVCSLLLSAFIVAYVGAPPVVWLSRRMPRPLAAFLVLFATAILLIGIVVLVVPLVANEWKQFAQRLPDALTWLESTAVPWLEMQLGVTLPKTGADLVQPLRDNLSTIGSRIGTPLLQLAGKTFGGVIGVAGAIANALLIPVLAFYLLTHWGTMWPQLERLIPPRYVARVRELKDEIDVTLGGFVRGQLLVSSIIGVLQAIGLSIVGIDGAIVIGLLGGLLNLIPYLGVAIGLTLALLMAALEFGGWGPIIGVLVVFAIVQVLEGFVITPRIIGDKVGLSPVVVIIAILAGGEMFGFAGLLLAIPAAAVLRVALREATAAYRSSETYLAHRGAAAAGAAGAGRGAAPRTAEERSGVESRASSPASEARQPARRKRPRTP